MPQIKASACYYRESSRSSTLFPLDGNGWSRVLLKISSLTGVATAARWAWFLSSLWPDVQEPEAVICVYLGVHASRLEAPQLQWLCWTFCSL